MNLGELSGIKLLAILVLAGAVITGGLYYTVFKTQREQNAVAQQQLDTKLRENAELEAYRPKLADIERQLASLKQQLGDLDRIKRIVRLFGMVNAAPGFDRMPQVIDGASDFFYELLGPENGQHARSAVGLAELPHGIPVEINGEFELRS